MGSISHAQLNFGVRAAIGTSKILTGSVESFYSKLPDFQSRNQLVFHAEAGGIISYNIKNCFTLKGQLLLSQSGGYYQELINEAGPSAGEVGSSYSRMVNWRNTHLSLPFGVNFFKDGFGIEIYLQQMFNIRDAGVVGLREGESDLHRYKKWVSSMNFSNYDIGPRFAIYAMLGKDIKMDFTTYLGLLEQSSDYAAESLRQLQFSVGLEYRLYRSDKDQAPLIY